MAITTPKFYDLESFKFDSPVPRDQIFPYAVGFTKKDGLWWSLVLSFLFPVQDLLNFKVRLSTLCGGESPLTETIGEEDVEDLYLFLKKYNPCLNRYSCFYNQTLKNLVRKFEKTVRDLLRDGEFKYNFSKRKKNVAERGDTYFQSACRILKSDIALCDVSAENVSFFRFPQDGTASECDLLTLYKRSEVGDQSNTFFCFGIGREVGLKLQEIALSSILRDAIYRENVKRILSNLSPDNNLIGTLVNQNMYSEICVLFKQPHILFKLEEAGYIVNPAIPDDHGNTPLYYAIKRNQETIVHQFYNYLSGATQLSGISPRNPEESILANLEHLGSVLKEHISKFEKNKSEATSVVFLTQLIKFNRFQVTMVTELLKQEKTDDLPSCLIHEQIKVEKRKRKIIAILSTYTDYFDFEEILPITHDSTEISEVKKFDALNENFKKYERYHQILDFNAALLFFDNLFSLKQNLILKNYTYETIESAFFRYIFTCSFYSFSNFLPSRSSVKKMRETEGNKFLIPKARCYHIVYMERLELYKSLKEFKNVLSDTHVTEDSIVKSIQESDLETVTSLPKIRDVVIFRAVLHYLDAVSKICESQEDAVDVQDVLIIERALQVIGECLNERSTSLGKSLLVTALPDGVRKNLRHIRDDLSHIDGKRVECRKNIESCKNIFTGIKAELKLMRSQIERSHCLLELLASEYVFDKGILHLKEILQMLHSNRSFSSNYSKHHVTQFTKSIKKECCLLKTATNAVQKEINTFTYHCNIKIHFKFIDQYMFGAQKMSKNGRLTKGLFHLSCVKVLFIHILEVKKKPNRVKEFTKIISDIESLAKSLFGEEKSEEGVQEIMKVKEEKLSKEEMQETMKEKEEKLSKEEIQEIMKETEKENFVKEVIQKTKKEKEVKVFNVEMQEIMEKFEAYVMKVYHEIYTKKLLPNKFKHGKVKKLKLTKKSDDIHYNGHDIIHKSPLPSLLLKGKAHFQEKSRSNNDKGKTAETSEETNNYSCIERLTKALNYFYPITVEEKHFIIDQVPLKFKEHSKAKAELLQIFEETSCEQGMPEKKVTTLIQKLLPSRKRTELQEDFGDKCLLETNIDTLKSIKDYYGDMKSKLDNNVMMSGTDFHQYSSNLELPSEEKKLLRKCVEGERFVAKNDSILNHLRDKIVILESLLIKSDPTIDRMWPQVKSSITKQHIIYRIKERYVRDSKVQAAVEMLLFDCMNILEHRTDLKRLWIKTSDLFSGLNLRNVLAHGNPLLEEVGRLLDPNDLPSEIVSKCLELVDDRSVVEAMCELYAKTGGTREDFVAAVRERRGDCLEICDAITRGEKWEGYASLIPSRSKIVNTSGARRERHTSGKRR